MRWFFIIFTNMLYPCVMSALDVHYKTRIENFYNKKEWTNKGFLTLEAMMKDHLAKHPAIEPCKKHIKLHKDYFTETLKCTSGRKVYTPGNGAMVTLDGLTYLSVPSMFRCFCLNPEHDFFILVTQHFGNQYLKLEKIYFDGIIDNQTAYSHWLVYTQKAIRQTYEGSDGYNQMADWYEKKFYDNMNLTCQSFPYKSLKFQRSATYLTEAFIRVDRNETITIPGYLCCIYRYNKYFSDLLEFYFVATRPTFRWTQVFYSNDKFNDTTTFNIDYLD